MRIGIEHISNLFLLLTAIVATVKYHKLKNTPLMYLPYYLWYAVTLEYGADILANYGFNSNWWYNIGINVELVFYFIIFHKYFINRNAKKFLLYGGIVFEFYFLNNWLILGNWNNLQVFPFTLGGIFMIIIIFIFLLEMFQSNKVLHTKKYLIFWISLGLLFYNIIPLPLFALRSITSFEKVYSLMVIQYIANIIMYLLFIYGLIWSSMKYK